MSIIALAVGLLGMGISLFFYKKGMVYYGFLVPPYMKKVEREKDPTLFWSFIITLLIIFVAIIMIGLFYTF